MPLLDAMYSKLLTSLSYKQFQSTFAPVQTMKAYREEQRYSSTHSSPCHYMKVSGQLHASAAIIQLPIEQDDRHILEPMWALRTTQKSVAPARNEAPDHPVHSPVNNRLHYFGFGNLRKVKVKIGAWGSVVVKALRY